MQFADGSVSVIEGRGTLAVSLLEYLAELLGLTSRDANLGECGVLIVCDELGWDDGTCRKWRGKVPFPGRFLWRTEPFQVMLVLEKDAAWQGACARIAAARRMFTLAVIARMLKGDGIVSLMHGALLFHQEYDCAALLFGTSGMGKSTMGRRFVSQGGCCPADDLSVLTFSEDGSRIVAQPAPTWSQLAEGHGKAEFSRAIPVKALLHQVRGKDDSIVPDQPVPWRLALNSCTLEFLSFPLGWLDIDIYRMTVTANGRFIRRCLETFPRLQVEGDLDGHIMTHLTEFLSAVQQDEQPRL